MINVEREINARIDKAVEREYIRGQKRAEEERERCAKIAEAWWSANQECIEYSVPAYQFEQLGKYLAAAIRSQDQPKEETGNARIMCHQCGKHAIMLYMTGINYGVCSECFNLKKEAEKPIFEPCTKCGKGPGIHSFMAPDKKYCQQCYADLFEPPKEADDEALLEHYIRPRIAKEESQALRPPPIEFTKTGEFTIEWEFPKDFPSSVPSNPEMEAHLL